MIEDAGQPSVVDSSPAAIAIREAYSLPSSIGVPESRLFSEPWRISAPRHPVHGGRRDYHACGR